MAKAPKNLASPNVPDAPAAPATDAAKVFKAGSFKLTVKKTTELPPEALKPVRSSQALPFKEWFSSMEPGEEVFLPNSFWVERDASVKPEVVRNKVHTAFKAWKEEEGHAEARKDRQLLLVSRVKDVGEWADEDGVQLFMRLKPASTT